ncbi:MAG: hypothetical protein ACXVAX_02375 [Pseudobdellovibrio sp.]
MNDLSYRIAQIEDVEAVFNYESMKHNNPNLDEIENQIVIWNSNYRTEALNHYFKLGWSFLALNKKNEIAGFFMGQPLLFVDKQTQSLWVEYISAESDEIYTELLDIAYRLSREKHFQRVLFSKEVESKKLTKDYQFKKLERDIVYLKTTK